MIICICRNITEKQLLNFKNNGCKIPSDVSKLIKSKPMCSCCRNQIKDLLMTGNNWNEVQSYKEIPEGTWLIDLGEKSVRRYQVGYFKSNFKIIGNHFSWDIGDGPMRYKNLEVE